jgi:hypothetical protein
MPARTEVTPLACRKPDRMQGTGARAGSCDDLTVTEEQISIVN